MTETAIQTFFCVRSVSSIHQMPRKNKITFVAYFKAEKNIIWQTPFREGFQRNGVTTEKALSPLPANQHVSGSIGAAREV